MRETESAGGEEGEEEEELELPLLLSSARTDFPKPSTNTSASTSKRCPSSASARWTPCLAKKGMPETKTRSRRWNGVGVEGGVDEEAEVVAVEVEKEESGEIDDEKIASIVPPHPACCCFCHARRVDGESSRRVNAALRIAL